MIERISISQQQAINYQRRQGRTDRQIEKIVGLPNGLLSRPFIVDATEEIERVEARRRSAESAERSQRFWRALDRSRPPGPRGWRPKADCVRSRPDEPPTRTPPKPRRGAA